MVGAAEAMMHLLTPAPGLGPDPRGGARLQKLVTEVLEEKGLESSITVEKCDCQGECGYGPNMVVDGKLFNGVKVKEDIMKVLQLEE